MRGDVVDAPAGQVVWRSASGTTAADGTLGLLVPVGMMTHVIAFDRDGRRAIFRAPDDDCFAPCAGFGGCGTCSHAPCTWPRQDERCASEIVEVALRLAKPAHVVGRVVDGRGRPVRGARVTAVDADEDTLAMLGVVLEPPYIEPLDEWSRVAPSSPDRSPIVTANDGRFAFDVIASQPFMVIATAPGYRAAVSRRRQLRSGASVHVDVRLRRAFHLDLHVVDDAGSPIAGARVAVGGDLDWEGNDPRTDAAGNLVMDGFDGSEQELIVDAEGYAAFQQKVTPRSRPQTVKLRAVPHVIVNVSAPPALLAAFGDRPILELQLLRRDESLVAGRVKGPESAPDVRVRNPFMTDAERTVIETAAVKVALARAKEAIARRQPVEVGPDGRGRAAIEEIPPGEYRVCVAAPAPGSCGPTVRVENERSPTVKLRLRADGSIASWD